MKSLQGSAASLLADPSRRRALQVAMVVLVLLFFGIALYSQVPRILAYNWVLDPFYLGLAALLLVVRGPVVVLGWWAIMRALGHPLPFPTAIRIGYHSALARYLPGQMWYAVSRVYLAEKVGVPKTVTAISVGLETALLVLGAGIVSLLSLLAWKDAPLPLFALLAAVIVFVLAQPRLIFAAVNWGLARLGRKTSVPAVGRVEMLKMLWPFVLNWVHYGVMSFALTAALYPSLSWSHLPELTGLFTAAWLVGFLAIIVPQGLVVREGLVFTFLTTLLLIPAPVATAAAVLSRVWTMLGEAFWASVSTRF